MHQVHILIDFENVQPTADDLRLIRGGPYRVMIFHGPHQNKFDAEMVKALQPLGAQVEYVQSSHRGKNALDFHVAFYLGRLLEGEAGSGPAAPSEACFLIVSADGGFDALLAHVQTLGFSARKVSDVKQAVAIGATFVAQTRSETVLARLTAAAPRKNPEKAPQVAATKKAEPNLRQKVIDNLRANPANRPSSREALEHHVATILGKKASSTILEALITGLERDGIVTISDRQVDYAIPKKGK